MSLRFMTSKELEELSSNSEKFVLLHLTRERWLLVEFAKGRPAGALC